MKKFYEHIKALVLIAFFLVASIATFAEYTSVQSGVATNPATWGGTSSSDVPPIFLGRDGGTADDVVISSGHKVTFSANYFSGSYSITINSGGSLRYSGVDYVTVDSGFEIICNGLLITRDLWVKSGGGIQVNDQGNGEEGRLVNFSGGGSYSGIELVVNESIYGDGQVYASDFVGGNRPHADIHLFDFAQWIGSESSTSWGDNANWYDNSVPNSTDTVFIDPAADSDPVVDGNYEVGAVFLCESDALTINSGSSLTLSDWLCVRGTLNIKSNLSGAGSLIINDDNKVTGTGTINVQRYIPTLGGDDWHVISSPVANIDLADFAASEDVYPQPAPYNDYDLAPYTTSFEGGDGGWGPYVTAGSGDFNIGEGYVMRRKLSPGNTWVNFTGAISDLNVGPVTKSVSGIGNAWNAVGNPYSSSIYIGTFLFDNLTSISGSAFAAYIWDPVISDYEPQVNYYAQLGHGFLVKVNPDVTSINFSTNIKNLQGIAEFKSAEIPMPTINLTATSGKLINRTKVKFGGEMTNDIDRGYDLIKLKGNPDIALFTQMPDNSMYDLHDLALPDIDYESLSIPIGLDFAPGGDVVFSIETNALPANAEIYLEDTETGALTLLNAEGAKYTTDVAADNSGTGRFNLVINKYTQTAVDLYDKGEFSTHTRNKTIYVDGPATKDTDFELYSIEGRCWYKGRARNMNRNTIDGSAFPVGVYILRIKDGGSIQSAKLVLTEN